MDNELTLRVAVTPVGVAALKGLGLLVRVKLKLQHDNRSYFALDMGYLQARHYVNPFVKSPICRAITVEDRSKRVID